MDDIYRTGEKAGIGMGEFANKVILAQQSMENLPSALDAVSSKLTSFGTIMTNVVSLTSGAASLFYALSNLVNVFEDDSLSGWQKFVKGDKQNGKNQNAQGCIQKIFRYCKWQG